MKNFLAVTVLLVSSAFAQTQPQTQPVQTQSAPQKKCSTLAACRAEIQRLTDLLQAQTDRANNYLAAAVTSDRNAEQQRQQFQEAFEKYNALVQDVLQKGNTVIKQLIQANSDLTDKYNGLLASAHNGLDRANARLARQQQITDALTLYSLMPKYTPPPQIVMPMPVRIPSTNCTSNTYGNTTYTNCN